MEENHVIINITNNQGHKKDTVWLWNSGRYDQYREEIDRVSRNPLRYTYDLSGKIMGGGYCGKDLVEVIKYLNHDLKSWRCKERDISVVIKSKRSGEDFYEGELDKEDLNYIFKHIDKEFSNISLEQK